MSRWRSIAVGVVVLLSVFAAHPALAAASTDAADGPSISGVTFTNESVAARTDGRLYLWKSDLQSVTIRLDSGGDLVRIGVCVEADSTTNGTERWTTCREGMVFEGNETVELPMDRWVANQSGRRNVTVTVHEQDSETVLDRQTLPVVVLDRDGDLDSDGLTDERELAVGTGVDLKDTDKDGLLDGTEVREYETDPLSNDTDGDGLHDAQEVNGKTKPTVADTDGDGLSDGREVTEYDTDPTTADTDGDGLDDRAEVTEYDTDPTVADTDGDGLDDGREISLGSDPTVADTDGDGLDDGREVSIGSDPTVADTDGDGLSDGREVSLGSDPTNGLTTPLILVGAAVVVVALLVLARNRVASVRVLRGRSGSDEGATAAEGGVEHDESPADVTPEPLLTDEDRVKQLLRENGGRLQQSEFVERTDWSKSKVSRLLSRMADDGEIEKITLGRENLITLSGEKPEGARPPFEE